ncbi:CCA tRNA nucleotidyltransferase [Candidatus Roizmanbacteria bacterium]|nr:CCA tRNA nucleotidyltransferase [Candidatus Roizmanbacteria bacterium]
MFKLPKSVTDFMSVFKKNNFQIYLVGGAVRDILLNKDPTNVGDNWDFATDATPQEILKLFPKGKYNNKYGTVLITTNNQQPTINNSVIFEITPFRKESDYRDLRHPEKIEWAKTIEEDLARRDFTINAIAYDGEKIVDPFKGQEHLDQNLIVAVGEPNKRFNEDALRLMRAIRFASELGFLLEDKTRQSIQKNAELITKISWERIRDELFKILASPNPAEGILFMRSIGLLTFILPEVDICFIIPQKSPKRHHIYDVGTHLVMALKHCPSNDVITRFATLLHDVGKSTTFKREEKTGLITFYNHEVVGTQMVKKIADRLRLSNKQKEKLVRLVQYHQFTVTELQTDKAVRRFIRNLGKEYLMDMLDLRYADRVGSGAKPTSWRYELFKKRLVEVQKKPFSIADLKVDGNDVMKILNIKPGPKVGEILKTIFNDVEEGRVKNERDTLLIKLKELKMANMSS